MYLKMLKLRQSTPSHIGGHLYYLPQSTEKATVIVRITNTFLPSIQLRGELELRRYLSHIKRTLFLSLAEWAKRLIQL